MAEQRKKSDSILLRTEGKSVSLELFPADQWPEENGGEGLFRARVNDVWYCPVGKYSFLTRGAIGELVAALLNGGEPPEEEPAPYLPEKADVRVYLEDSSSKSTEIGSVRVSPYQKRDGRWYCQIWVFGRGVMELCCNDVTLCRVRR
ncbi:MAG: hypothetical protein LBH65_06560 [Desulfovibrio sp.]|nr:hypothetical protein [Desulfovibrio sp.]